MALAAILSIGSQQRAICRGFFVATPLPPSAKPKGDRATGAPHRGPARVGRSPECRNYGPEGGAAGDRSPSAHLLGNTEPVGVRPSATAQAHVGDADLPEPPCTRCAELSPMELEVFAQGAVFAIYLPFDRPVPKGSIAEEQGQGCPHDCGADKHWLFHPPPRTVFSPGTDCLWFVA